MRNQFGLTLDMIPDPCTFSEPGSDIYVVRKLVKNDDGFEELVATGKQSISSMINAWADYCDMAYIISRLNAGDASVLDVVPDTYGDVSDMPHDHRAALNTIQSARTYFDNLPEETRAKFDNDFAKWFSDAGSEAWSAAMTVRPDAPAVDNPEGGDSD